jgi:alginate biosynthesis protein AlgX
MIRRLMTLGLLALLPAAPALAQSESAFGCARLNEATPTPYIEGKNGVFFRLNLDLRLRHTVTEGSLELMARLSEALADRGTTLIYVPVPSKGLAMPQSLPDQAAAYGFDHDVAAGVYEDTVARLRELGVVTVDALTPLLNLEEGQLAFISTDHHWSSAGSRAVAAEVARAIAEVPGYADLEKVTTETRSLGVQEIPSPVRREIQAMCRDTIPSSSTEAFATEVTASAGGGGGIFAAEEGGPAIALVGTSMSRTPAFNFAGFLAEEAKLDVVNYAVIGGNQYGAIVSYLMSDEFLSAPPKYLVWENPIYNNLGEFGELPMRELVAAAIDDCVPMEAHRTDDRTLLAEVPGGEIPADTYIRADAGNARGRAIEIGFVTQEGLRIAASIERTQRLEPTRLFYQYMEPFWEPHISTVEVQFDRAVSDDASLAICKDQETAS